MSIKMRELADEGHDDVAGGGGSRQQNEINDAHHYPVGFQNHNSMQARFGLNFWSQ